MKSQDKVTLAQWNQLSSEGKEKLRIWAVKNGYELDIIPSATENFDPACDYAALLTKKQLIEYISQSSKRINKIDTETGEELWRQVLSLVED